MLGPKSKSTKSVVTRSMPIGCIFSEVDDQPHLPTVVNKRSLPSEWLQNTFSLSKLKLLTLPLIDFKSLPRTTLEIQRPSPISLQCMISWLVQTVHILLSNWRILVKYNFHSFLLIIAHLISLTSVVENILKYSQNLGWQCGNQIN